MIELDWGGGRKLRLREWQKNYDATYDGPGVELSVHYNGERYWIRSKCEPGKSLREAREKGMKALEAAVRAGTPGEIILEQPKREVEDYVSPFADTTLHLPKRGPGRPRKEP